MSTIVNRLQFGSRPMGDYVTKKRKLVVEDHLELFGSNTDVEVGPTTNGTAEHFCLYQTADTPEFRSESDVVVASKDKPAKRGFPKPPQKVVYKIPRKHSARHKSAE